jgi:hypothetical protein
MVTAAKNPATYGGIPLAFIGSFHTQGITSVLRENNIGYIVIEPVRSTIFAAPQAQAHDFARFISTRNLYFRAIGSNKGAAELSPLEVKTYVIPRAKDAARRHDSQSAAIASRVEPISTIDPKRLSTSILNNPYGLDTSVAVGGGGALPPDAPKGAFAYFESSDGHRLTILGSGDERWKADDSRYRFLSLVALRTPEKNAPNSSAHCLEAMTLNWHDLATGWSFVSYYDGPRDRLYLVESPVGQVSSFISRPVKKGAQTTEFGLQLAERNTDATSGGDRNVDSTSARSSKN